MVSEPYVNFRSRERNRTYVLGPGGLPCIGYSPVRLVAAPCRNGTASRVGRKFHKVIVDNLRLVWYWPQWHRATAQKRFTFLKSKYKFDFVRLYKSEHSILGMLTQSSWDLLCRALLSKTKPRVKRRRPDINSPDPNDVRGALNADSRRARNIAKKRRNVRRRGFQRSNRRDKRRAVLFAPGSVPDPRSIEHRSDFSREMERNEILRRRDAFLSSSQSGLPTTRQPSVVSILPQPVEDIPPLEERYPAIPRQPPKVFRPAKRWPTVVTDPDARGIGDPTPVNQCDYCHVQYSSAKDCAACHLRHEQENPSLLTRERRAGLYDNPGLPKPF